MAFPAAGAYRYSGFPASNRQSVAAAVNGPATRMSMGNGVNVSSASPLRRASDEHLYEARQRLPTVDCPTKDARACPF